jgi:hypothetical protein
MGASGYVETPGPAIHREIIPAAFAADFEPFDNSVPGIGGVGVGSESQTAEYNEFFQEVTVPL